MGDDGETCFTGLGLGIGIGVGEYMPCKSHHSQQKKTVSLDLSFPHHPKEEAIDTDYKNEDNSSNGNDNDNDDNNDENNNKCRRKKLRLTKEQYTLLEDSFNSHHTLNSNQKQTLAGKLNLQPRQVEVWFQNRRARTKLKQTEVDCEYLKKCCASLSEENRRLKKELRELVALKFCPFYIQFPKAVAASELNICPSCDEATTATATDIATDIATATATDTATITTRAKCEE